MDNIKTKKLKKAKKIISLSIKPTKYNTNCQSSIEIIKALCCHHYLRSHKYSQCICIYVHTINTYVSYRSGQSHQQFPAIQLSASPFSCLPLSVSLMVCVAITMTMSAYEIHRFYTFPFLSFLQCLVYLFSFFGNCLRDSYVDEGYFYCLPLFMSFFYF